MATFDSQTGSLPAETLLHQRYRIIGLVGWGGMSAVYQAIDIQSINPSNTRVALKELSQSHLLSEEERQEAASRFLQEARLLGSLSHPNLPRIHEAFSEEGRYYLVMDYIEGKTLLQLMQENHAQPLPLLNMLHYAIQLCSVLDYLHQQQPPIIFRDLKPSNVMVTADERVFLIDFGIARLFKEGQPQDTLLLGSPGFASPEQHGLGQTNPRSDIYSLGATIHCCLTGKDPCRTKDRFTFASMRLYNPQVSIKLDELVQRMLNVDEEQRPASAAEVQQTLIEISRREDERTQTLATSVTNISLAPTQLTTPSEPLVIATASMPSSLSLASPLIIPIRPQERLLIISPDSQETAPIPGQPPSRSRSIWTGRFTVAFFALLFLGLGITLIAASPSLHVLTSFSSSLPFTIPVLPSSITDRLSSLAAACLSGILLLVALFSSRGMHSLLARIVVVLTVFAALASDTAFLALGIVDIQQWLTSLLSIPLFDIHRYLDLFSTGCLLMIAFVSLLWLARPFTVRERILLFVFFGGALACALAQFLLPGLSNILLSRQLLVLIALVAMIQGTLLAKRAERVLG